MRLVIIYFFIWLSSFAFFSTSSISSDIHIKKNFQQTSIDKFFPDQKVFIKLLQSDINFISEVKLFFFKIKGYQQFINNFLVLAKELRKEINQELNKLYILNIKFNYRNINRFFLRIKNLVMYLLRKIYQDQDIVYTVNNILEFLLKKQNKVCKDLKNIKLRLHDLIILPSILLEQTEKTFLKIEKFFRGFIIKELLKTYLSIDSSKEISCLLNKLLNKSYNYANKELRLLLNCISTIKYQDMKMVIEQTGKIAKSTNILLPNFINIQLQNNYDLSYLLNKQIHNMDVISFQQRQVALYTLQVYRIINNFRRQSQWLDKSPALGEILRTQVSRLPEIPKSQQLDHNISQLRVQSLYFIGLINQFSYINKALNNGVINLNFFYRKILKKQFIIQYDLLNALLTGCKSQILELTKLKIANDQLEKAINEIQEISHRYLFWIADVSPINISYLLCVSQDIHRLITVNIFYQLVSTFCTMFVSKETITLVVIALLFVVFSLISRQQYYKFLEQSSKCIGKVNQDRFSLTIRNIFWSFLISIPLPLLWEVLGYGLRGTWFHPIAMNIGDGIDATAPLLWVFMVCSYFALPQGLFIVHFGWPKKQVKRALRYYRLSIGMIIPLIIALIFFDNYSEREFAGTLGRLCFLLFCACLALINRGLKRAGIPLYLNTDGVSDNSINRLLWNLMICVPIIASVAACIGLLRTAQILLARVEISVSIWFFLLIVYHIIRRWMFIQRRRIAFDRAKQRRADILFQRARNEKDPLSQSQLNEVASEVDEKMLDLDVISAKSLQLVRSILMLVALLSVILLWSELRSAFSFLENITLWSAMSVIKGVGNIQPITLGTVLISILVFIITVQMVRNLPALLELAILQHLYLTPGTGYAITTLTKYSIMFFGVLIGFSIIGIEWSKLQWLIAALGVGFGFGLQEIFVNFISGLIILFERPIRIGDTITIRDLTGNVTRINTRATTITDWDKREIIVPNKAFITEQFINWSLSDTVTRVVLHVPAPTGSNVEQISYILIQAACCCPLVLVTPAPEVFLVDLQQGLPLFELRMYAAEVGHRMPLRHQVHALILDGYRNNGMELPFPPFHLHQDQIKINNILSKYMKEK